MSAPRSPLLDTFMHRPPICRFWIAVALMLTCAHCVLWLVYAESIVQEAREDRARDILYQRNAKLYRVGFELYYTNQYMKEVLDEQARSPRVTPPSERHPY
jgi:hypothetical protein